MIPLLSARTFAGMTLRQKLILAHLVETAEAVTTEAIARAVGSSVRSVRRDLQQLEEFLPAFDFCLEKRAGEGLRLGGRGNRDCLREVLSEAPVVALRPVDRQTWLACSLLAEKGPVKLAGLAVSLRVAVATVVADLDALAPWFAAYDLVLQRKRGWGVTVEGDELECRNAAVDLFFAQFDETGLRSLFDEPPASLAPVDFFQRPAWLLISPVSFRKAGAVLRSLERTPLAWGPNERTEFGLDLALLLERVNASCPARTLKPGRGTCSLSDSVALETLASALPRSVPDLELARLRHLFLAFTTPAAPATAELRALVGHFVAECEGAFGQPLSEDGALFEGLLVHLNRSLRRLRASLSIRNPLLGQIREQYPRLFASAREAADRVFGGTCLPDAEIGFLVLHIGASLERRRYRRRRVLVVCPTGVGTSNMLSSRLRTELPEIDVVGVLAMREVATVDPTSYDLILSTVTLDMPRERYLVVSPLLQPRDKAEILTAFDRLEEPSVDKTNDGFLSSAIPGFAAIH